MSHNLPNLSVVILAAGKGVRMGASGAKVMQVMRGRPLIDYVVSAVEQIGVKPVVVVAAEKTVAEFLGARAVIATQEKQLGTGNAVAAAKEFLPDEGVIVVLYGDMPNISADSIRRLVAEHREKNNVFTLITVTVPDYNDWRAQFYDFGRIARDPDSGRIIGIVEKKDATLEELKIKEVNTSYFCFQAKWLWANLPKVKSNNSQGEYYLTDLAKLAFEQGQPFSAVAIDPKEAVGVNTKEHLDLVSGI